MGTTEDSTAPLCCANCFGHQWLKEFVRARSVENGSCLHCGARQVRMIRVEDLAEPFTNVLSDYVDESYRGDDFSTGEHHWAARPLHAALQEDWAVFSPATLRNNNAQHLMGLILTTAKNRMGETLKPDSWVLNFSLHAMRTEWRFWNRIFAQDWVPSSLSLEIVREQIKIPGTIEYQVGNHLPYFAVLIEQGTILFRARPGCESNTEAHTPYRDVGQNPQRPASRANTDGQLSMYLSEAEITAVAEVRQPVGSFVSVGDFVVSRDLTVVDLCQTFENPNPFVTTNLPWILDLRYLLRAVAETMSKPAQTPREYSTTQLLANIARAVGYEGMRYPSALDASERNVVLFELDAVHQRASWVNVLMTDGVQRV